MAAGVGVLGLERMHQHLHAVDQRLLVEPIELPDAALEVLLVEAVLQDELALLERLVDSGTDLVHQWRLGDVVQGAQLEALDRGRHLGDAGEHHDGHVRKAAQRLAQELEAVHDRHVDVGDDQRHLAAALEVAEGFRPGRCLDGGQAVRLEDARDRMSDLRVIIDHHTVRSDGLG
jgi:hypothetical protein